MWSEGLNISGFFYSGLVEEEQEKQPASCVPFSLFSNGTSVLLQVRGADLPAAVLQRCPQLHDGHLAAVALPAQLQVGNTHTRASVLLQSAAVCFSNASIFTDVAPRRPL